MMGMFIRSQDGKHLVEATSVDLDGAKILVNGEPFAAYEDEEVAQVVTVSLGRSEQVRRWWPFLRDRRIDAYNDILKRFIDED